MFSDTLFLNVKDVQEKQSSVTFKTTLFYVQLLCFNGRISLFYVQLLCFNGRISLYDELKNSLHLHTLKAKINRKYI